MLTAHSVDQVRQAEAALMAQLPEGELMQRAVAGLTSECVRLLSRVYGARVVVVAGSGDNGGDALYATARLARRGAKVEAVLLDEKRAHAGGLAALRTAGGRVTAAGEWRFAGADLVLDGVVGIGGRGGLRPDAAAVFDQFEHSERSEKVRPLIVAVDLPSGIDADTGEVTGPAVHADVTVTFGTYKPGLLISPGAEHVGDLRFVDIGLAPHLEGAPVLEALEEADVQALLPTPSAESNKYRRGVVGIAAGSPRYPGAAVLASGAALRSGAGAVRFVGEPGVCGGVLAHYPEVMIGDGRVQAWVVGPGLGPDSADRVATALAAGVPVLVDADGLTALTQLEHPHPALLTPHAGEAARLLGAPWTAESIEAHRLTAVRELADRFGCTVLLKGSTTLVADPGHTAVRVNRTGTPALATAGSGDVLSGLAGGLLAAGLHPLDAASTAAHLHGKAARDVEGRHPGRQLISGDLIEALTAAGSISQPTSSE
jgi:hydroxyethylthiazole kinase-like uncharacterized protein yjeF